MMTTVLPTPAPPNAPTLPPFEKRTNQVDDLNAGCEDCVAVDCAHETRRLTMDGIVSSRLNRSALIHRVASYIEDSAQNGLADRHGDGPAVLVIGSRA